MDGFEVYFASRPNAELRRALIEFFAPLSTAGAPARTVQYEASLELLADDVLAFVQSHLDLFERFDAKAEERNVLRAELEALADQIEDCRVSIAQLPFSPSAATWSSDLDALLRKHRAKTEQLAALESLTPV